MKLKFFQYAVLIGTGCVVVVFIAAWQNHRTALQQTLYPAESFLYRLHTTCSDTAPTFLDASVTHALSRQGGVSAQIANITPDNSPSDCAAGVVNPYQWRGVDREHRYRYASMTKLVTARALLQVLAAQQISLDTPLLQFFPELAAPADPRVSDITLRHLLNHQAGFDRTTLLGDSMFIRNRTPWCPGDLAQLTREKLYTDPGTAVNYSNLGYCLLGAVISRVSGLAYQDYVEQAFGLAARDIRFIDDHFLADEVAYDYRFETDYNHHYLQQFDFAAVASAAGLSGSATAFAQLLKDIYPPLDVTEAAAVLAQCEAQQQSQCYYEGARLYRQAGTDLLVRAHEGYLPGAASIALLDQWGGITVLVKSGANRPQARPEQHWLVWFYAALAEHCRAQGVLARE